MIIETPRLILRQITWEDSPFLSNMLQNPEIMYAWEHGFTEQEVKDWINKNLMCYATCHYGCYGVIHKENSNMIGICGLVNEETEGIRSLGIGYIFHKDYWHKGYAIEAAKASVDFAFQTLKANELTTQIRPDNLASRKVAEKLGMKVKKEFIKIYQGKSMPHLLYTLKNPYFNFS